VLRAGRAAQPVRGPAAHAQGVHGRRAGRRGQLAGHAGGGSRARHRRGDHEPVLRHRLGAGRQPHPPVPRARRETDRVLRPWGLLSPGDRRAAPIIAGVVALLCVLPPFLSSSWLLVMFLSFVWLVITANYDVLDGFLGYVNLGQGAFFGLGAYVATILLNVPSVQQLGALAPLLVTACALVVAA